jgi:hypothetical protein
MELKDKSSDLSFFLRIPSCFWGKKTCEEKEVVLYLE